MIPSMCHRDDYLALDDGDLLAQCDVHLHRSSGPGGQHRNKVSSAVRLRHRPTGLDASASDSRSQHENKRLALRRLRMNLACRLRRPVSGEQVELPDVIRECMLPAARGRPRRIGIGRKDHRFWRVSAFLLDVLDGMEGRLAPSAEYLGITTSNLVGVLKCERHVLAAARAIRRRHGRGPLS